VSLRYGVFSYGVLSGASLTALYGRYSGFSGFLEDFWGRQGCF